MDTPHPCIYCGQFVMYADPNITLDHRTICPACLKKNFPKAAKLLQRYNRHAEPSYRQPVIFSQSPDKRPPGHSD